MVANTMKLQLLTLLHVFSVVYGQVRIPAGVQMQCFNSRDCTSDTSYFTGTETTDVLNCCLTDDFGLVDNANSISYRLNNGECRTCDHPSVTLPANSELDCYDDDQCIRNDVFKREINDALIFNSRCCGRNPADISHHYTLSHGTCNPCYSLGSSGIGNDPHFLLPLPNGEYMCFSIQGQPNFAFSLISDKYIRLNGQFILPAPEESHTIANVSTFLGDLGLVIKNPVSDNVTTIKVSAQDHSVTVGDSVTIIKDRPVMVEVLDKVQVTVDAKEEANVLKDASTWLYINTEGFGIKVKFYKKHLNMFMTKTSGLTKEANGIIGQFLTPNVTVDEDAQFIRLNDGDPIPAKKAPIWPFMGISGDCWYGTATDNQGTGVIKGDYTDFIVEHLVAPTNN